MQTHILPREIFGKSTFLVAMLLMKTLPVWLTDRLLVSYTYLTLGDTARVGIPRPSEGPMVLKEKYGKTPILDVGTLAVIKSGQVKVWMYCTLQQHLNAISHVSGFMILVRVVNLILQHLCYVLFPDIVTCEWLRFGRLWSA